MTVETTARKQSFAGGQSALTFTFRALTSTPSDIKVKTVTSGTETLLTYTTDYTVTISSDGVGGTAHVVTSVGTTHTYEVFRETTNTQESDYDDYNQFPADTLETSLDRVTLVNQEQAEILERSIKMPITSSLTGSSVEMPSPSAGFGIVWNTASTGLILTDVPVAEIATEASNYATSASTSATEAANSATTASTSATAAGLSATTASTQATLAGNYATSSSTSATESANYVTTASTQATLAGNYATTASTAATTASTQAALASNYATTSSTSATLAGNYATTASTQATTASTQATLAGNYATSSSTSATEASNYATTASTQATLAGNYATTASTAAATIPDPTGQTVADQIRVNAAQNAYELFTPVTGVSFTPRLSASSNDYTIDDFTQDGNYHDLDLSSLVGSQVAMVHMWVHCKHGSADQQLYFRPNGSSSDAAVSRIIQTVANTEMFQNIFSYTDAAGVMEYKIGNGSGSWSTINLTVLGYIA